MRRFRARWRRWRRLCESCPAFLPLLVRRTNGTRKLPVSVAPAFRRESFSIGNARLKAGATKTKFERLLRSPLSSRRRTRSNADSFFFPAAAFCIWPDNINGAIFLGRLIGGLIDLHDHAGVLGSDKRLPSVRHAIQKVDGLCFHGARVHVIHFFAGHGG